MKERKEKRTMVEPAGQPQRCDPRSEETGIPRTSWTESEQIDSLQQHNSPRQHNSPQQRDTIQLLVRPISVHDLERILEIEQASYRTPWTSSDFLREISYNQMAYYYLVEAGEKIAGFIGMWLVVDEAHITNIAVSPDFRRQGVGEKLLLFALELAAKHGARCGILEVRVSNARALNLYLKHGFRYVGLRKAYYRDNDEDAFLMEVKL